MCLYYNAIIIYSYLILHYFYLHNSEIETLKVVKIQNQPFQTPDVQLFKAALQETKTNTLLELPSLAQAVKNISNTSQNEVCI